MVPLWLVVAVLLAFGARSPAEAATWERLAEDGVHDPDSPAIGILQEPHEALRSLPRETGGNRVNWMEALERGSIRPRGSVAGRAETDVLDLDILMKRTHTTPYIEFRHRTHTEWLDCSNCHDEIFKAKAGANRARMFDVLKGQSCGRCHGVVAFPLDDCARCHSVPHTP